MNKKPTYEEIEQRVRELEKAKSDCKRQEALLNHLEFLQTLIDSIPAPIFYKDAQGIYTGCNKAFENFLGKRKEDIIGKTVYGVSPGKLAKIYHEKDLELMQQEGIQIYEASVVYADGTIHDVVFHKAPFKKFDESLGGLIGVILDITERKKAESEKIKLEAQLFQSQKMEAIGALAGGIAHDFNNMLGVIMGNVSYVLSKMKNDDDLTEALLDVQKSVKQATNLTKQLITFAKGGAPIKKAIELNSLIKETTKLVLRGSASTCNFNLAEDLWAIEADEGQLNQALSNLIINANQAMPEGGIIQIDTENEFVDEGKFFPLPAGPYVSIKITDQGIGIPEKYLSKIFDPFFTTKHKGSGLGLATTFSIIQSHGGHIWAESIGGEETTFVIYLPASEKPIEQTEHEEELTHLGHGKILIMDDQESILRVVVRMFNRMGYAVETATDGAQAIELYRTAYESGYPFDLVILDLTVPGGMGGAKTIPELLKIDPKIKAVVSSGYSNDPIMSNYKDYGFCSVMPKPYTKSQLADVLNQIFDKKS